MWFQKKSWCLKAFTEIKITGRWICRNQIPEVMLGSFKGLLLPSINHQHTSVQGIYPVHRGLGPTKWGGDGFVGKVFQWICGPPNPLDWINQVMFQNSPKFGQFTFLTLNFQAFKNMAWLILSKWFLVGLIKQRPFQQNYHHPLVIPIPKFGVILCTPNCKWTSFVYHYYCYYLTDILCILLLNLSSVTHQCAGYHPSY